MPHTPGPWETDPVDDRQLKNIRPWTVRSRSGYHIAHVIGGMKEVDANARLITAAPDLLKFAEEMAACSDDRFVVAQAKAVIAKARGE